MGVRCRCRKTYATPLILNFSDLASGAISGGGVELVKTRVNSEGLVNEYTPTLNVASSEHPLGVRKLD